MKHLTVIFLFTFALFAKEHEIQYEQVTVGIPYVQVTKGHANLSDYASFVLDGEAFLLEEHNYIRVDGKVLLLGAHKYIRLWNLKNPALNRCLTKGYYQDILANREDNNLSTDSETRCTKAQCRIKALTASSEVMFLSFYDGRVERWDLKTWEKIDEFKTPPYDEWNNLENFNLLSVDDENHKLIAATASDFNHTLYLYDLPSMTLLQKFHGHYGQVCEVSPIIDDKYFFSLACIFRDNSLRKWDITTGEEVKSIRGKMFSWNLPGSRDGKYIVLLDEKDKNLTMYDTKDLSIVRNFIPPKNKDILDFIVNSDEKTIYATLKVEKKLEKSIVEWDMETGKETRQIKLDHYPGKLRLAPNEKYLAGNLGSLMTFWRLPDFKTVVTLYPIGTCGWVIMTPEGYFNASEDAMASIRIKGPDGQERALTPDEIDTYYQPKKVQAILNDIIATQNMEE